MPPRAALLVAVAALLGPALLAACSGADREEAGGPSVPAPSATSATSAPPSEPAATHGPPDATSTAAPVSIAFAGDVHFEGRLRERLVADPATALAPVTG